MTEYDRLTAFIAAQQNEALKKYIGQPMDVASIEATSRIIQVSAQEYLGHWPWGHRVKVSVVADDLDLHTLKLQYEVPAELKEEFDRVMRLLEDPM